MLSAAVVFTSEWWGRQSAWLLEWASTGGLRIIAIAALSLVFLRAGRVFIRKSVGLLVRPTGRNALADLYLSKRQATLSRLLDGAFVIALAVIALVMILGELRLNIGPLLASAGIAGVAIGFGAQSLVRDVITGAFIIMERQFSIGDVIRVDNLSGAVEELNLRTTVLRDADGSVHIIPNGEFKRVTVMTRDWSRLVLDFDVAYEANLDTAMSVLRRVLDGFAARNQNIVLDPPEILGVEKLGESSVQVRAWMRMLPGRHWAAGRELRAAVKNAFQEAGIEIPFPQRAIRMRHDYPSQCDGGREPGARPG